MYTELYGLPTITFRYFNVYGERQPLRGQYAPVIGIFLRQRAAGEPLTIVGDGNQRRDFTYVGDVVSANIMAAISNPDQEAFGQVYNVGTGNNYSINQIVKMFDHETVNIVPRPGETRLSLANNQKMKKTFGWNPTMKLENWLATQL
jgi:UDP-glucose 4-epimerase